MTAFCLRAIEISGMFLDPNFVKFVKPTKMVSTLTI